MHKRPRAKTCFSSTYTVSTTATAVSMAVVLLSCACAFQLQPGAVRDIHVLHNQDYRRLVPSGRGGFADFRRSRDSNWALREAEMAASVQKVSETESLEGSIPVCEQLNMLQIMHGRCRRITPLCDTFTFHISQPPFCWNCGALRAARGDTPEYRAVENFW